jgi:prephenate dehydrogenase
MTADGHDAAVAAISHLPLVLSVALVEAMTALPGWPEAAALAAGGWSGMTRLARGDATMGAGILATNAAPTAARLRALRATIDDWLALLDGGDPDPQTLRLRLAAAHELARVASPGDDRGTGDGPDRPR